MKTNNFSMDLMVPGQAEKDVVFNESLLLIDQFLNNSIIGFISDIPDKLEVGNKFIISDGKRRNQICFLSHESKELEFLTPSNNSIIFSKEQNCFFLFDTDNWIKINTESSLILSGFIGISGEYQASNASNQYLYLSNNCTITLGKTIITEITIIIKQNAEAPKIIEWPDNILWENNHSHVVTTTPNSLYIIKLFSLPESNHFLGKIIS